jgi:hypothetical protein
MVNQREYYKGEGDDFPSIQVMVSFVSMCVVMLTLGSRPRQRGCKGAGQEEARESHHILPGV